MASDRLSVRIPERLKNELDALIDATGRSEADVVRAALEEYCQKQVRLPTAHDIAKQTGVIGCIKGGAKDRSSNPIHLEGMGRDSK